ncbi:MAG: HAMP domain-containing sensor histidine kinase [Ginsengibacter sp.]
MKLLTRYNRINIPIIIGALLLSGFAYYYMLQVLLLHQLNHDLEIEEQEVREFVKNNDSLPHASIYKDQEISFDTSLANVPPRNFTTEEIFDASSNENELYRQLVFPITVKNKVHQVIIKKSQEETEYFIKKIATITLLIILLLIVVLIMVNRFVLRKLWEPFHLTVEQLKQFNISSKNKLQLNVTKITEFAELNKTAAVMTDKVTKDYETLKSFTENASHEIQTPLAIMKMKLELLMQYENMSDGQVDCISALNEATDRLSRLNQSLLLLTKIDNSQFIDVEEVDLSDILLNHINNYEELASAKNICIKKNIAPSIHLQANRSLIEILISNIITNTIKHNYKDGWIEINLSNNALSVSNTGNRPLIKTSDLFERFKKSDSSSDSLGLGLAIVKKICETYGFHVTYNYTEPMHAIVVNF